MNARSVGLASGRIMPRARKYLTPARSLTAPRARAFYGKFHCTRGYDYFTRREFQTFSLSLSPPDAGKSREESWPLKLTSMNNNLQRGKNRDVGYVARKREGACEWVVSPLREIERE